MEGIITIERRDSYSPATRTKDCFDPPPEQNGPSNARPQNDLTDTQYREIATTLMVAEVSHWQVGVPWFLPSARKRKYRMQYTGPLAEYLRYSLVGITTATLESYCEDLESSFTGTGTTTIPELHIDQLSWLDRYGLCILIFVLLFLLCTGSFLLLGLAPVSAVAVAFLATAVGTAGTAFACAESQRRNSLHYVLYREVLRREGLDDQGSGRIRIMSVEPN